MSGLLWTRRIGLFVMLALFLAGMDAAQISPRVQLRINRKRWIPMSLLARITPECF